MAAPESKTIKSLDGRWVMNKTLGDSPDPVLTLQGISWLTRKAIGLATVTLHIKTYNDDQNTPHIDIDQTITGGLKGTSEKRTLDWMWRPHSDWLFGDLRGRSRFTSLDALRAEHKGQGAREQDAEYLCEGWLDECRGEEGVIESFVEAEAGWSGWHVWGFTELNGKRTHIRRFVIRKGEQAVKVRMVYDWEGELQS